MSLRCLQQLMIILTLSLVVVEGCVGSKNDAEIQAFLSEVSFVHDSLLSASIARVEEIAPEPSCIVYASDISCSACIAQLIHDLLSMESCGSELTVWIASTSDPETVYYVDYYLFDKEKKKELGLSDLRFKYYVMTDVSLPDVVDGLYLLKDGRIVNVLRNAKQ